MLIKQIWVIHQFKALRTTKGKVFYLIDFSQIDVNGRKPISSRFTLGRFGG